ncbi:MAG TPA: hypothetical protein VGL42_11440 [Opitutaceae bacterium]|jgi:MFS family permease
MQIEALYQLADDELRFGLTELSRWQLALNESGGIQAVAIQAYWRLRAQQIQGKLATMNAVAGERYLQETLARVAQAKTRSRRRHRTWAWTWTGLYVLGIFGIVIFGTLMLNFAHRGSAWAWLTVVLFLASAVGTVVSLQNSLRLRPGRRQTN